MAKLFSPLRIVFTLLLSASVLRAERISKDLDTGWKFIRQHVEPTAVSLGWETVKIPHTWNALDGQIDKNYYRGEGWYARGLDIPREWKGKRVFVYFEGASLVANTFLNGNPIGEHRGGFTAFCYELTPSLKFGGANDLRVQVSNAPQPDVAPLAGDFNVNGGIYRPARLIVTDPVCITPLDYASPGVYLTLVSLSKERAQVEVKTLVSNGSNADAAVQVETQILDAGGHAVASQSTRATIAKGQTLPVKVPLSISQPHRWNGRLDPYLYAAKVRVSDGHGSSDEVQQPLGLRTVAISEKEGFELNGQPYPIRGVNRHQDRFNQGWALSPADNLEDSKLIQEIGATAVRNAHYPQSANWHDLADQSGLLLWDEVSLVDEINETPAFSANAELQLRELIAQLYNHPSVAFWGIFNELGRVKTPDPDTLLVRLKAVVQELDPSRLIVAATCRDKRSFNLIPDHTAFNRYPGWYGGRPEDLKGRIAAGAAEIGKRTALSEYGAGANPTQHQEGTPTQINPRLEFHPEEWQTYCHEQYWAQIKDNPKLWGSFVWVMFDFASASRTEGGVHARNDKGLVTADRKLKKDAFYFYKANWNPEPMVYIAGRRITPRTQPTTQIKVYSNTGPVELKVNGKSLGSAPPDPFCICRWENVALAPGKNIISVNGRAGQKAIADQCEWEVQPSAQ